MTALRLAHELTLTVCPGISETARIQWAMQIVIAGLYAGEHIKKEKVLTVGLVAATLASCHLHQ